ncbi:putative lectin family integral membrane protein [Xylona heveae TC161]|uniref:Putative lectin family integral membrane protein n=1 Tax=Xylona heveae (strain CBS 132557 / TC161) TaxID=1328760 RepID=A0A165G0I8_XYLHT|nr:putative lectin family integral membrane protein [Xylona heveae TC161]KZF21596.1 putative lectin family integral membrane protein [Xylona heveae TC161]
MLLPRLSSALGLLALSMGVFGQDDSDVKSIPLRTHSLVSPYLDTDMQSRWFDFGGDTIIRADQYIRLTSDRPSQQGWLFSRVPLTATNWEVEFEFKIHGQGNLHGDGMAIWVTKQRSTPGPVFGSTDRFEGLGIFFDTYKNNRPGVTFPYVMAMMGDGQTTYDQANDGKANELAGCSARGLRGASVPTKARMTYFQDKSFTLDLQYKREDDWQRCFEIPNLSIPSVAYLGFSAETGELSDNHDIIRVDAKNLYSTSGASGKSTRPEPVRGKSTVQQKKSGGWLWFFFKLIMFGGVCYGGFTGYKIYIKSRRSSRF